MGNKSYENILKHPLKYAKGVMELTFCGVLLWTQKEQWNLVDSGQLNAATAHEAVQQQTTQFAMIDDGETISIRNRAGLEVISFPSTEENRDFYSDKLITPKQYELNGGRYADVRRAVFNGDTYYMETYDTATGEYIERKEIEHLEDDINNNSALSVEAFIDLAKVLSGDNVAKVPSAIKDQLAFCDIETGEITNGTPAQVLSAVLQKVGLSKEEVDRIFEGTVLEDPEAKEARKAQLADTDYELAGDQYKNVVYYDAVKVNGKLDIEHAEVMEEDDIEKMVIYKYEKILGDAPDKDDKMKKFVNMFYDFIDGKQFEDYNMQIAKLVTVLEGADDGTIDKTVKRYSRTTQKIITKNGFNYKRGKESKFDQFDKFMDEKYEKQYEETVDIDDRLTKMQNAHEEAVAFVDERIATGNLDPRNYNLYVEKQEAKIVKECGDVTLEDYIRADNRCTEIENDQNTMRDLKFLTFVAHDVQEVYTERRNEEVAEANSEFSNLSFEEAQDTLANLNSVFGIENNDSLVTQSASSITSEAFYDSNDSSDLVTSDELSTLEPAYTEDDSDMKIYVSKSARSLNAEAENDESQELDDTSDLEI